MNRHRKATYAMRREVLNQIDVKKRINIFIDDEVKVMSQSDNLTSEGFDLVVQEAFNFDSETLDRLFDTETDKFEKGLRAAAKEQYEARETAFGTEIMRKVERDVYLQVLDNLWMQHLENMDHLREGIHWMSVGQRDPLVEYRRQGQLLFESMQGALRADVIRLLFHAEPVAEDQMDAPIETELTRAARLSSSNVNQVSRPDDEFEAADFEAKKATATAQKNTAEQKRKKARKAERQRKNKARKHK
jgi:preprotein translocase subunit SecA